MCVNYIISVDEIICPHCHATIGDRQEDSGEPYKEEYCGSCNNQFGYEEKFVYLRGGAEIKKYKSYKLVSSYEENKE